MNAKTPAKTKRLLVIGIDGLDPNLLSSWSTDLPHISSLATSGINIPLKSVVPPDSIPAWATVYSGLDPSQHGMLGSIDYLRGTGRTKRFQLDLLRGKTFWDMVSRAGKKVCVLNPFIAYPAWPVNGVMMSGPSLSSGEPTCFPPGVAKEYDLPPLGGFGDRPSRVKLEVILDHSIAATLGLQDLGCQLLEDLEWNLFFVWFPALDCIEHFFWRFGDQNDPSFPGPNPFQSAIKEFYVLIDKVVDAFCKKTSSDDAIMIVSDHGHRRRPTKLVNLNELLRREGLLVPRGKLKSRLIEEARTLVVRNAQRLGAERLLFRLGDLLPKAGEIRKSKLSLDFESSVATVADLAGSTCFGGINLNQSAIHEAGLEDRSVEKRVTDLLLSLRDPKTGLKLVKEVSPRGQIYSGKFADKFPDIFFVLQDDYGVHWSIYDALIVSDYGHRLVSGGHRPDAVFILSGVGESSSKWTAEMVDIAPTILHILGVEGDSTMMGQSLISN